MSVAVPLSRRSTVVLALASAAGLMMLAWPLLLRVPAGTRVDPPFLFLALLPIVITVVLAEVSEGGMDARVLAILGVLSAANANGRRTRCCPTPKAREARHGFGR